MSTVELAEAAQAAGVQAETFTDLPGAFESARRDAGSSQPILVTGSFYLVGELLRHMRGLPPPPPDGRIDSSI